MKTNIKWCNHRIEGVSVTGVVTFSLSGEGCVYVPVLMFYTVPIMQEIKVDWILTLELIDSLAIYLVSNGETFVFPRHFG